MGNERIDQELFRRVDEVLFYIWDPIRMSYEPACRDEYTTPYVGEVCQLLTQGKSVQDICQLLCRFCSENMQVGVDEDHCLKVAEYLVECKEWICKDNN